MSPGIMEFSGRNDEMAYKPDLKDVLLPRFNGNLPTLPIPGRRTVDIIVHPWSRRAFNIDRDVFFHRRAISITGLDSYKDQAPHFRMRGKTNIRFLVHTSNVAQEVSLPADMGKRLLWYLRYGPPTDQFDCGAFVHFLNGLLYVPGKYDFSKWWASPLNSEDDLEPGQTILINRDQNECVSPWAHSGIYLDQGLYISKFGYGGGLMITTLEEQKKAFEGTAVWVLDKRITTGPLSLS